VFELYDQGLGYKSIAMKLNGEGFRTNQGRLFRVMFICRVLRNRAYIGILDYNLFQGRGSREPIEIPGFYPAIVDSDLFSRVQRRRKRKANPSKTPSCIEPNTC
jgi:site-specific DNA recombinase